MTLQGREFEEWKEQFIADRLMELLRQCYQGEFTNLSLPTAAFFGPDNEIRPNYFGSGFKMDDTDIYRAFLNTMHEFVTNGWPGGDKFGALRDMSIQYAIIRYFRNITPTEEERNRREARIHSNADAVSIRDTKREGVCSERAAVAHNLLCFSDVENYFYVAILSRQGHTEDDVHALIVLKNSKGDYPIYDPSNPQVLEADNGSVMSFIPAIFPGGDKLLSGEKAEVEHRRFKDGESPQILESTKYTYIPNPIINYNEIIRPGSGARE